MDAADHVEHDVRMSGFIGRKSFREVRQLIQERVGPGDPEEVSLRDALGRVLAEDVVSTVDVPYFRRSAMDGYACRAEETSGASEYNPLEFSLIGDSFPGNSLRQELKHGEAAKIMTGGEVPTGANAVMMAEHAEREGDTVRFRKPVPPGKNVMRVGEDIAKGDVVMAEGRRLRPQDLGVLASVHRGRVNVFRRPSVAILVTGNELVEPGEQASGAKIVDSNSYVIEGLARLYGGLPVFNGIIEDQYETIRQAIGDSTEDLIVVSGGTSVGEEDYAPRIVQELGNLVVHGVAMKPGSPFGMGFVGERPVFLIPGSPVAAMITADAFVGSAIRRRLGQDVGFAHVRLRGRLRQKIVSSIGRTEFVRVQIREDLTVEKVRVSGSSILSSATRADGLLVIDEEVEGYAEGTEVEVYHYG